MKSGFVALVGRSNVGKSTLLNALVGSKVAIVTPKPQTTRRPIRGVLHDPRGQVVFVDTPGIFLGKKDLVSTKLNEIVRQQVEGIELIVYVMDPTRAVGEEEESIRKLLKSLPVPIMAVINKSDLKEADKPALADMRSADVGQSLTLEISALKRQDLNRLVDAMFAILPEGDPYYPDMQITDLGHNEWLEELIREKAFLHLDEELPYSVAVKVESAERNEKGVRVINAIIWTTEERYKRMIIGSRGSMLRQIGMDARKEIEAATGDKVYLELIVKFDPKWPQRFAAYE